MIFNSNSLFDKACALDDGIVQALLTVQEPACLVDELKAKATQSFDRRSIAVYDLEQTALVVEKMAAREQTKKSSGHVVSLLKSKAGFVGAYENAEGELAFYRAYSNDEGRLLVVHSHNPKDSAAMNAALLSQYNDLDVMAAESHHDPLTDLLNRRGAEDRFAKLLASARSTHNARADSKPMPPYGFYLTLDLDKFKNINDTYGHEGGDVALKFIGKTLSESLRPEDLVVRLGGDEFAASGACETPKAAVAMASRLLQLFKGKKCRIGKDDVSIGMSIGVIAFRWGDDGLSLRVLNETADKGLYEAKQTGRGKVVDMGVFSAPRESSAPDQPVDKSVPSGVCKPVLG